MRSIALGNMLAYVASFAGALALLKLAGGDVGYDDPNDPNMFKVSFGDFHYDLAAGFVQPVRYLARMVSTQIHSNKSKRTERQIKLTRDFVRSKLAPVPGSIWNLQEGKNFIGEKVTAGSEAKSLVMPMIFEDFPKAIESEGANGALKLIPSIFGIGTSIYKPKGQSQTPELSTDQKQQKIESLK